MKRIKAACLLQTICFQPKDACPSEICKQQVKQEYESYKAQMNRRGTKFKILEGYDMIQHLKLFKEICQKEQRRTVRNLDNWMQIIKIK